MSKLTHSSFSTTARRIATYHGRGEGSTSGYLLSEEQFKQLEDAHNAAVQAAWRQGIEDFITQGWGSRCKTKDSEDFPELAGHGDRCPCCAMWEAFDHYQAPVEG